MFYVLKCFNPFNSFHPFQSFSLTVTFHILNWINDACLDTNKTNSTNNTTAKTPTPPQHHDLHTTTPSEFPLMYLRPINNANRWLEFARSSVYHCKCFSVLRPLRNGFLKRFRNPRSFRRWCASHARLQKVHGLIRIASDSWLNDWTSLQGDVHHTFPPKNV